ELLVVIVTISILALIALQAAGAAITAAREARTKSVLFHLKVQVQRKAEALERLQKRSIVYVDSTTEMTLLNKPGSPYLNLPIGTKRTLVKKLQLGHYFPQDLTERWDASIYPPGQTIEDALLQTPLGNWLPDDDLHMIDGWGNPIVFYRWPTALFAAHPEL